MKFLFSFVLLLLVCVSSLAVSGSFVSTPPVRRLGFSNQFAANYAQVSTCPAVGCADGTQDDRAPHQVGYEYWWWSGVLTSESYPTRQLGYLLGVNRMSRCANDASYSVVVHILDTQRQAAGLGPLSNVINYYKYDQSTYLRSSPSTSSAHHQNNTVQDLFEVQLGAQTIMQQSSSSANNLIYDLNLSVEDVTLVGTINGGTISYGCLPGVLGYGMEYWNTVSLTYDDAIWTGAALTDHTWTMYTTTKIQASNWTYLYCGFDNQMGIRILAESAAGIAAFSIGFENTTSISGLAPSSLVQPLTYWTSPYTGNTYSVNHQVSGNYQGVTFDYVIEPIVVDSEIRQPSCDDTTLISYAYEGPSNAKGVINGQPVTGTCITEHHV